jgi:hypothetical protein
MWNSDIQPLFGNPTCAKTRVYIQVHLVLKHLVNEPNVRFYPLASMMCWDGIQDQDNLITFPKSSHGPVVCYFNRLKIQSQAPITQVLSKPTADAYRTFYRTYREGKKATSPPWLYLNESGRRMTENHLLKLVNEELHNIFPGRLTTKLIRLLETNDALSDKVNISFNELRRISDERGRTPMETIKYLRFR